MRRIDELHLDYPFAGATKIGHDIAVLGEPDAAIVVATVLQRSEHSSEAARVSGDTPGSWTITVNGSGAIKSPGGYLRALTQKARAGDFALGPMLMALRGQRLKAKLGNEPETSDGKARR